MVYLIGGLVIGFAGGMMFATMIFDKER